MASLRRTNGCAKFARLKLPFLLMRMLAQSELMLPRSAGHLLVA
jgi:hypothetical protein